MATETPPRRNGQTSSGGSQAPADVRSVGEMLFEADFQARQLLLDAPTTDAALLLRSWRSVVEAASTLWQAIPRVGLHEVDPMPRMREVANGIDAAVRQARWPGHGPTDEHLDQVADTFTKAAGLVRRYADEIGLHRADARADIGAARMRLMHTLYTAAHGIGVSLHERGRSLYQASQDGPRPRSMVKRTSPYAVAGTAKWIERMRVCERAAGAYVGCRFAQAIRGEATPPPEQSDRLQRALVAWDIQAHRTLAADPSPVNLAVITRTQSQIGGAALVLLNAATQAQAIDPSTHTERLSPAITEAEHVWTQLANRWGDLVLDGTRMAPDLAAASAEVRAACRDLTHDGPTLADPEAIAARTDLNVTAAGVLQALEASVDLAHLVRDPAHDPTLTGPARALSVRAHNETEVDTAWVRPQDVLTNRHVPLPTPVADRLARASDAVIRASVSVAAVATIGDKHASPPSPPEPKTRRPPHLGPDNRPNQPPTLHP